MDETGLLSDALEMVSIALILLVSALGIVAQIDCINENSSDPRAFRALIVLALCHIDWLGILA